ncbi:ISAs1 family transposase [Chloroflexales bacterium ZM16-3]|nr:ISAs1 family transposase [Chloroflexales bacterium ZM16-3]
MAEGHLASIATHFGHLTDPRVERTKAHNLVDILTIAICAILCGAEGPTGMETFGNAKIDWLRTIMPLPNGVPSHDTFSRVLAQLNPAELQAGFTAWFAAIQTATQGELIAVDGKTLRKSAAKAWGKAAIQMVSAWASTNRLILGQEKVHPDSNEITAVPALLEKLALAGCIVTVDALHCQVKTAETIIAGDADYVLAAKGNQETLHDAIQQAFADAHATGFTTVAHDTYQTEETQHGRWERRTYWTLMDPTILAKVNPTGRWPKLNCIGMVRAERRVNGKTSVEERFYISSLNGNARIFGAAVRGHWEIENVVHWTLDLVFREDECRVSVGKGAENLAVLRHIALNLLQQLRTAKRPKLSMKQQRFRAALDTTYLLQLLIGPPPPAAEA